MDHFDFGVDVSFSIFPRQGRGRNVVKVVSSSIDGGSVTTQTIDVTLIGQTITMEKVVVFPNWVQLICMNYSSGCFCQTYKTAAIESLHVETFFWPSLPDC
jgi:hypothetical protein